MSANLALFPGMSIKAGLDTHEAGVDDLDAGLEKTRKKKKPAQWFFWGFLGSFGFFVFYTFSQKREFLGFFQFQEYFY